MSLRDQLIAKGLASKKRARQVQRELKQERKQQQASKVSKAQRKREAKARREAELAARQAERDAARDAFHEEHDAREHRHRVRQIIVANRLGGRGPVPFHHRVGDTGRVGCLWLKPSLVNDLRVGRAAIAGFLDDAGRWEHHVIGERAATKLALLAPEALVHHVRDADHLGDPAELPLSRDWEPSLRPHRVREGEALDRFLEGS